MRHIQPSRCADILLSRHYEKRGVLLLWSTFLVVPQLPSLCLLYHTWLEQFFFLLFLRRTSPLVAAATLIQALDTGGWLPLHCKKRGLETGSGGLVISAGAVNGLP